MARIFISYRRQDSPSMTGRIYDQLETAFGSDRVFRDINDIGAGQDFRAKISQEVDQSDVLLVIIGPKWESITDTQGKRRLDNPDDFVRLEVEAGLKNPKKVVIPVLVENTPMPNPETLPKSLRELCFRNAVSIRQDPDFHPDMQKLINQIRKIDKGGTPAYKKAPVMIGAGVLGVALLAIFAARLLVPPAPPPPETVSPVVPDSTLSATSTSSPTTTITPTGTETPPTAITEIITETSTPTPSHAIRIGIIQIPSYIFTDIPDRLNKLGYEAEWIRLSSDYNDFIQYDIIYLPIGWAFQDELIESKYSQYKLFVRDGGGLVIEQPNSKGNLVPELSPYKILFSPMRYDANEWPPDILMKHQIVDNLRASELPGPGNKITPKDDHWQVLATSAKSHTPTLAVAVYGKGRIVVLGTSVSKNPQVRYQLGDHFVQRFIEWVSNLGGS